MSDAQLGELETRGFVRLAAVVTATEAGEMENRVWTWLAGRNGVDRDDRSTWPVQVTKLQPLRKAAGFDGFINARTSSVRDGISAG